MQDTSPERSVPEKSSLLPSNAGLGRRIGAFVIDAIVIMIVCLIISYAGASWLFEIGPYGRFIGFAVILLYFGAGNSQICGGKTPGKRLCKIEVVNDEGDYISFGRSCVRALFLAVPIILNSLTFPTVNNAFLSWILTVISAGTGLLFIYMLLFNRSGKKGIHDLLLKTRVIYPDGEGVTGYEPTSKIHRTASIILIILVIAGFGTLRLMGSAFEKIVDATDFAEIMDIRDSLADDDRFFTVTVGTGYLTFFGNDGTVSSNYISTDVWFKGKAGELDTTTITRSIATTLSREFSAFDEYDEVRINLYSKADLGVASRVIHNRQIIKTDDVGRWLD